MKVITFIMLLMCFSCNKMTKTKTADCDQEEKNKKLDEMIFKKKKLEEKLEGADKKNAFSSLSGCKTKKY